jgi:hypothetical protein
MDSVISRIHALRFFRPLLVSKLAFFAILSAFSLLTCDRAYAQTVASIRVTPAGTTSLNLNATQQFTAVLELYRTQVSITPAGRRVPRP